MPEDLTLNSVLTGRGGLDPRAAGFNYRFMPGKRGRNSVLLSAGAEHIRPRGGGWFPGALYSTGVRARGRGGLVLHGRVGLRLGPAV